MIAVRFVAPDGSVRGVWAPEGVRLLDVARADGQPLEGTCDGDMACATCHVILDPADFARLPPATSEEEDLLDLAPAARRTSRLACQIVLSDDLGSLTVQVPGRD